MNDYSQRHQEVFPIKFLLVIGIVLASVLIFVFCFRILNLSPMGVAPKSEVLQEITLKFEERDRFDVVVYDTRGNLVVDSSDGANGFVGVVYKAIKRERLKKRLFGEDFIKIRRYSNGRVSIFDEITNLEIYANSFGLKNMEVFGSLFDS